MIKADLINNWTRLRPSPKINNCVSFLDSYIGLIYQKGSLNFIDLILLGNLPPDCIVASNISNDLHRIFLLRYYLMMCHPLDYELS